MTEFNTVNGGSAGTKTLRVGSFEYVIDEGAGKIEEIVAGVKQALADKTATEVPVLDFRGNRVKLFLNGAAAAAVVVDLGEGPPKPGEMS